MSPEKLGGSCGHAASEFLLLSLSYRPELRILLVRNRGKAVFEGGCGIVNLKDVARHLFAEDVALEFDRLMKLQVGVREVAMSRGQALRAAE